MVGMSCSWTGGSGAHNRDDSVREQRISHTLSDGIDGIYREARLLSAQRMVGWWLGLSRITGNASCQS